MKITYVVGTFPAISETFILNQITGLLDRGHDVNIIALRRASPEIMHAQVGNYELLRRTHFLSRRPAAPGFQLSAEGVSALTFTDVLHAHFCAGPADVAMHFSRLCGIPYVTTAHAYDIFINPDPAALRERLCSAARAITVTDYNKRYLIDLLGPKFNLPISVIRYGIDLDQFTPGPRPGHGVITLLCIARLVEKKGVEYTLRGVAAAVKAGADIRLRLVGDGPLREPLHALANELKISERVDFLGARPHEAVLEELRNADLFILPSVTAENGDREGLPNALIEAQASGLPVISTVHTGIPELVRDGVTGILAPERDAEAITAGILALASNAELRRQMGAAGRRTVEATYGRSTELDALEALIDEVAADQPTVSGIAAGTQSVLNRRILGFIEHSSALPAERLHSERRREREIIEMNLDLIRHGETVALQQDRIDAVNRQLRVAEHELAREQHRCAEAANEAALKEAQLLKVRSEYNSERAALSREQTRRAAAEKKAALLEEKVRQFKGWLNDIHQSLPYRIYAALFKSARMAVVEYLNRPRAPRTEIGPAPDCAPGEALRLALEPVVADASHTEIEARPVAHMQRFGLMKRCLDIVYSEPPLISVIMTTFNSAPYVERAVRSILEQGWRRLELLVVDDCSTDLTRSIVERVAAADPRVSLHCFGVNRGTYWSKNFGITKAAGDVITFMDSDDYAHPDRLERQFELLNQRGTAATTCSSFRVDENDVPIMNRGLESRLAPISMMIKRPVFEEIGFFDSVRTSADDEMLQRIRLVYGAAAQKTIATPLLRVLVREGSLSSDAENGVKLSSLSADPADFLSKPRLLYSAGYRKWHQLTVEQGCTPYMPFPVVGRPFPAFGKVAIDNRRFDGQAISACMATYPARRGHLELAVASLLDQVDRLFIYLNGYWEPPDFLRHPRITTVLGAAQGETRDNGKFFFMDQVPDGYCFTVDDDIRYPPNYTQSLIRKIELYDRLAVVGVHGVTFAPEISHFFDDRTVYGFRHALERDTVVNLLGTGTVAFHTSLMRPEFGWFELTGMADVFFAIRCMRMGITLIAVDRAPGWMSDTKFEAESVPDLFSEFRNNAAVQTELVKACRPWNLLPAPWLEAALRRKAAAFGPAFARECFSLSGESGQRSAQSRSASAGGAPNSLGKKASQL